MGGCASTNLLGLYDVLVGRWFFGPGVEADPLANRLNGAVPHIRDTIREVVRSRVVDDPS
jgi:hypothetical protein